MEQNALRPYLVITVFVMINGKGKTVMNGVNQKKFKLIKRAIFLMDGPNYLTLKCE